MTTTPTDLTDLTDPTAPSRRALRVLAGCGLLLLALSFVFTMVLGLADAIDGDGVAGGFLTAAFWSLGLGALAGVTALVNPHKGLVAAAYALAVLAPVLALMD